MKLMEMLPSETDFVTTLTKKLAPPLVTLLSSEPEFQYVATAEHQSRRAETPGHSQSRDESVLCQVQRLIRLASQANIAQVLSELKE